MRAETLSQRRIAFLQPFNATQIRAFLVRFLGDEAAADRRLGIVEEVRDLIGHAAETLTDEAGFRPDQPLAVREISPLMADFFKDLVGAETAERWADAVLDSLSASPAAKANALLLRQRLDAATRTVVRLHGENLRGRDFSGQDLTGADLSDADLTDARLVGCRLCGANLADALLIDADLSGADLRGADLRRADLTGARLLRADLTDALLVQNGNRQSSFGTSSTATPRAH
jgi:hypothetical protein